MGLSVAVGLFVAASAKWHAFFDLRVYRTAVTAWLSGGDLYRQTVPAAARAYGFTYPPFAALVMMPLAGLPWPAAVAASITVNVTLTLWLLFWLLGPLATSRGWSRWFVVAIAAVLSGAFEPLRDTISFGQINVLLLAFVAADLLFLVARRHPLGGVLIGLAAAIKLTPGMFMLYLLLTRRWRAAAMAGVTAAGVTVLAAVVAPSESRDYWTHEVWDTARLGDISSASNQSLNGLVARLHPQAPNVTLWLLLVLAVLIVWAWGVRRVAMPVADDDSVPGARPEVTGLALTGAAACLVSPTTWVHHLVWLLPAITCLVTYGLAAPLTADFRPRRTLYNYRGVSLALAGLAYGLLSSHLIGWLGRRTNEWKYVGGNLYVELTLLLLFVVPLMATKAKRPPSTPDLVDHAWVRKRPRPDDPTEQAPPFPSPDPDRTVIGPLALTLSPRIRSSQRTRRPSPSANRWREASVQSMTGQ